MNIKIYPFIAAALACASCLSLGSCTEADEYGDGKYRVSLEAHKLSIKSTSSSSLSKEFDDNSRFSGYSLNCNGTEKTYTFSITAENTPWAIKGVPSWITLSPRTGTTSQDIEMKVEANTPTETERKATLTLESTDPEWEYSIPITITQEEASPKCYTLNYLSNFDSAGGTGECNVAANFTPTIAYEGNSSNWILASVAKNNKTNYYELPGYTLRVTAKPNEETSSRTGYVLLQYNGKTYGKVEVSQYAFSPSASVSNSYYYIDSEGTTKTITYSANFTPTLKYDDIKSWCTASLDTDKKSITLKVAKNNTTSTRSGYLYLTYKGKTIASVSIYQYAFSPSASFASYTIYLEKAGETKTVSYTANFSPTLQYDDIKNWCTVSINTTNKTVTVKATKNDTDFRRSGYIYLMYNGRNIASTEIYQYGY